MECDSFYESYAGSHASVKVYKIKYDCIFNDGSSNLIKFKAHCINVLKYYDSIIITLKKYQKKEYYCIYKHSKCLLVFEKNYKTVDLIDDIINCNIMIYNNITKSCSFYENDILKTKCYREIFHHCDDNNNLKFKIINIVNTITDEQEPLYGFYIGYYCQYKSNQQSCKCYIYFEFNDTDIKVVIDSELVMTVPSEEIKFISCANSMIINPSTKTVTFM